jgi:hypothetical protein
VVEFQLSGEISIAFRECYHRPMDPSTRRRRDRNPAVRQGAESRRRFPVYPQKKPRPKARLFLWVNGRAESAATAVPASAGGTGAPGVEFNAAGELEAHVLKIDFDRLNFAQKIVVHEKGEPVDVELLVVVSRLIQSQRKGRTRSAALVQKYPDGLRLAALEIFRDLLGRRGGDFQWCRFGHVVSSLPIQDAG